jgi:fatty-acyl-CoA synthase
MIHADILGERARLTPAREALVAVDEGVRLDYATLNRRANRAARLLRDRFAVAPGERFGVLAHNSVAVVELLFGAAKSGAVIVPLNGRAPARELAAIVADSGMRLIFAAEELAETAAELRALRGTVVVPLALLEAEPFSDDDSAVRPFEPPAPDDLLALLYTSGTTGKPKGVMLPHRMVAWNAYNTVVNWGLRADDRSPVFTPLHHAGGLSVFLTPLFLMGGTIILHRAFDADSVWRTIAEERCTVLLGVPTIFRMLAASPLIDQVDRSSIRWMISGGAPLPASLVELYASKGIVLEQGFGMTEVGVNCFAMTEEEAQRLAGSIGRPMMFTATRIVRNDGTPAESGEVGELQIRGPHVSAGYWRNDEATNAAFIDGGWFRTGDLARVDAEGNHFIAGREKEMFISGGVNVYPAEIEAELAQHPMLADAAVVPAADETWGEVGVAFVVRSEGAAVTEEDLTSYLSARLARYKIPKRYVFVDLLPRTAYGKVVRAELRERLG